MLDFSNFGLGSGFGLLGGAEEINYGGGSSYNFLGDYQDASKLQAVQPGPAEKPWWENLLSVGVTRAIDSHFDSEELDRVLSAQQIGIQGANGYTYRPGVNPQFMQQGGIGGISLPMLLLLGFGAYVVLKAVD